MGIIQLIILFVLMVIGVYFSLKELERLYFKHRRLTLKEKRDIIITDHNYLYRIGAQCYWKRENEKGLKWSDDGYQID